MIFRELFPRGITLLDLKDVKSDRLSLSNIAARQEVRDLLKNLSLPGMRVTFDASMPLGLQPVRTA